MSSNYIGHRYTVYRTLNNYRHSPTKKVVLVVIRHVMIDDPMIDCKTRFINIIVSNHQTHQSLALENFEF